jgi:hypothetical protein
MYRKIRVLLIAIVIISFTFFSISSMTYPTGAPAGHTGSPSDKVTCTQCHHGIAITKAGCIKSNVDSSGYKPGTTYTISLTSVGLATSDKFGFQVSPQNASGKLLGKIVVTDADETQIIGKGKYITHTHDGINSIGSKSWKFNWIAPEAGTGDVTFYGAFVIGPKPYGIVTSTLILKEKK